MGAKTKVRLSGCADCTLRHKQLVCSIPKLSAPYCHLMGKINTNILLYETSVFMVKMADHDGNHTCLVEKIVPIVLILPNRWQDGVEHRYLNK